MSNPFIHPSAPAERPDDPLRGWTDSDTDPGDLRFYTLVDDLESVFGGFRKRFRGLETLDRRGFLVLATGYESYGKTSLLGNCAAYLQKCGLPRGVDAARSQAAGDIWWDSSVKVVDISGLSLQQNAARGADAEMYLFKEVLLYLRNRGVQLPDKCDSVADAASGYRALVEALGDDGYLVVLLPPVDTVDQVVTFLHLVGNKIVFLAESSSLLLAALERQVNFERQAAPERQVTPEQQAARLRQDIAKYLYRNIKNPPDRFFYHMHIGPMREEDYWRYADRQLRRMKPPVQITEAVVRQVREHRSDSLSIGQWRGVLRQIFDNRPGLTEVQYSHFVDEFGLTNLTVWQQLEEAEGQVL